MCAGTGADCDKNRSCRFISFIFFLKYVVEKVNTVLLRGSTAKRPEDGSIEQVKSCQVLSMKAIVCALSPLLFSAHVCPTETARDLCSWTQIIIEET